MHDLYAIIDGTNQKFATVSDDDNAKIGRRYDVGHSFGVVTDIPSGKKYEVFQAQCNLENCNCAVTVQEVK
jgi:hypothetical protein